MSDFKELKAPIFNGIGWYIVTKVGHAAWLTVNGDITSNASMHRDILYHKTELEAHQAARDYYNLHGLMYIYTAELQGLQKDEPATQNDINESQEMTF